MTFRALPSLLLSLAAMLAAIHQAPGAAVSHAAGLPAAAQDPPGPGGPGGPGLGQEIKLVKQYDRNGDGWLNREERDAARAALGSRMSGGRGRRGGGGPNEPGMRRGGPGRGEPGGRGMGGRGGVGRPGGPGGRGGPRGPGSPGGPGGRGGRGGAMRAEGTPGPAIAPADVAPLAAPLYDSGTLRTVFLEFEHADWEQELAAFYNTDVEIPATLIADGTRYRDVGVHFRGASSFMSVSEGLKRSLNVSLDFRHENQQVAGYRTLNLLNSHDDPTFLRSVLFYDIARGFMPAPKANHVRVVINGESWGVYVNVQQFNKEFIQEWFGTTGGARWKVPGSPGGRGGLEYLGEDVAPYARLYEIKSQDDPSAWKALIALCRVLNETPADRLDAALAPILDVDRALRFLALDTALVNNDGYWVRASDYSIYLDVKGRFHILPNDANETFSVRGAGPGGGARRGGSADARIDGPPMRGGFGIDGPGPGGARGMGPGAGGAELDPLVGLDDPTRPLRSKLLAVPSLRAKYLGYVREIAARGLDWTTLGPRVDAYRAVIAGAVKADTRKLDADDAFDAAIDALRAFADRRRTFLLDYKISSAQ
jgi:spore coat protein CotH